MSTIDYLGGMTNKKMENETKMVPFCVHDIEEVPSRTTLTQAHDALTGHLKRSGQVLI